MKNIKGNNLNILITGAAGYIGSLLSNVLKKDHDLVTVDNLMYNQGYTTYEALRGTTFYKMDVDDIPQRIIENAQVIIPLAAYVGMPSCKNNPKESTRVNLNSIKNMISNLRDDQLVIYPNTNSSYGSVPDGVCTEETPLNGISHYAKLKDKAEQIVLSHPNSVVFRLATVFGVNPFRNRVDLLVNTLVYESYFYKSMDLFDNNFRRNYISIHDIVRAFEFAINNVDKMRGCVYNIGADNLNCTKGMIAQKIKEFLPDTTINLISKTDPDQRDYEVSSKKIYDLGFFTQYDFQDGINELINYYSYLPKDKTEREKITQYMRNDKFIAHDH